MCVPFFDRAIGIEPLRVAPGDGHQESIGSDASEGCIRVGDNDIELVYCLLYPTRAGSQNKASTIDIRN